MLLTIKNRISSLGKGPGSEDAPAASTEDDALWSSPLNHPLLVDQAQGLMESEGTGGSIAASDHQLRLSWFFDPAFYLNANPDVAESGMHPYLHFLVSGIGEGRSPHPLVDLSFLASALSRPVGPWTVQDLAAALRSDEASPHPLFDVAYYLKCNPDVREAGWHPFEHFLAHGAEEGRSPNPDFLADWYLEQDPALPRGRLAAFVHFVRHGLREGRLPGPSVKADAPEAKVEPVAQATRSTHPVEGRLDEVRGPMASGWAWAPGEPDTAIVVELVADGRIVGLGTADLFRADLQEGGLGDGHHAFRIPLSRSLQDGHQHLVRARARQQPATWLAGAHAVQLPLADQDVLDAIPLRQAVDAMVGHGCDSSFLERAARAFMDLEAGGEPTDATGRIEALADEQGDCGIVIAKLAEARLFAGDAEAALPLYDRAFALGGVPLGWLYLGKGTALRRLDRTPEAAEAYAEGLRLAPGHARLEIRSRELTMRERLLDCSKLLADNRPEQALAALGDLLLHAPGEGAVQSLALQAARVVSRLEVEGLDATLVDAHRELDLLETVLKHLDQRGGSQ